MSERGRGTNSFTDDPIASFDTKCVLIWMQAGRSVLQVSGPTSEANMFSTTRITKIDSVGDQASLTEALDHIRRLLAGGDVRGAREFLSGMVETRAADPRIAHLATVLAEPRARAVSGATGRCLTREREWLRAHAQEYPGQWVAVAGDQLIAADQDLKIVLAACGEAPGGDRAVVSPVPGAQDAGTL